MAHLLYTEAKSLFNAFPLSFHVNKKKKKKKRKKSPLVGGDELNLIYILRLI